MNEFLHDLTWEKFFLFASEREKKKKQNQKIAIVFIRIAERTESKGKMDEKRLKTDQIKMHLYTGASDLDMVMYEHRTPLNFEIAVKLLHL